MNILFIGDIVGKPGLEMVTTILKSLLEKHRIDFCVANGENLTEGKGFQKRMQRNFSTSAFMSSRPAITCGTGGIPVKCSEGTEIFCVR